MQIQCNTGRLYKYTHAQTVFTLYIAINRAEYVGATKIIKHKYMLTCKHKIRMNIMLCIVNSTVSTFYIYPFKMASTWRYTLVCLDAVMDISTTD